MWWCRANSDGWSRRVWAGSHRRAQLTRPVGWAAWNQTHSVRQASEMMGVLQIVVNPMGEEAEQSNGSDRTRIDERQPDTRFTPGSKGRGVLQER